jgi:predicted extracellular nuclease
MQRSEQRRFGGTGAALAGLALVAVAVPASGAALADTVHIHDIQGAAHVSPLLGRSVEGVPGVVTAVSAGGFWMQDGDPDNDPATSEGIYVDTGTVPTVTAGDRITVAGTVREASSAPPEYGLLSVTEIGTPQVTVVARDVPLPAPVVVGPGGRTVPPAVRADAPSGSPSLDVEAAGATFAPAVNALDFFESLEGMLVRVVDSAVVGPTQWGNLTVLPGGVGGPRTARGGLLYDGTDVNTDRIILGGDLAPLPAAKVSDVLPGPVDGVLTYGWGNYQLDVLRTPAVQSGTLRPETASRARPGELSFASYNLHYLSPTDPVGRFDGLAHDITGNLRAPDILAVQEVLDDSGLADDGTVTAGRTWGLLIDAIRRAGGPQYAYRSVDPQNDVDEPGSMAAGNTRVGFLFRPDRVTALNAGHATATSATAVVGYGPRTRLTLSPGRVDPNNPAFGSDRKPVAVQFRVGGRSLYAVTMHLTAQDIDQPIFGRYYPRAEPSVALRVAEAAAVRSFVDTLRRHDRHAAVVLAGDLNDGESSAAVDTLVGDGWLRDLPRTLPAADRYSFNYQGNSLILDHLLVSGPIAAGVRYDEVHIGSEFADGPSDHDPPVAYLRP